MPVITFISDFGESDHYVAAVKARMFQLEPNARIFDISHKIKAFDIIHGAFTLKSVFRDFPEGTIHIVGVNTASRKGEKLIAASIENHIFLARDNGLLSLITDANPDWVIELESEKSTFPVKDILVPIAARLYTGVPHDNLGSLMPGLNTMFEAPVKETGKMIIGNVIHVDRFGNLIVNITRTKFNSVRQDRNIKIKMAREGVTSIKENYNEVEEGELVVFFNESHMMEIAINKGNASKLLGLKYDSPVIVSFL